MPFPCAGPPCLPDPHCKDSTGNMGSSPVETVELDGTNIAHRTQKSVQQEASSRDMRNLAVNPNVDVARYVVANGTEMFLGLTDQTIFAAFNPQTGVTTDEGPCPWHDQASCSVPLC